MATVAIILNTTKRLTHNEHPIALRVTHHYKRKYYSINTLLTDQSISFRCRPDQWRAPRDEDNGLGKLLRTHTAYKECNIILERKLNEAKAILKRYDEIGMSFSFAMFEADLTRKEHPNVTLLQDYYTTQVAILEEQGRIGMSGLYYETQRILKKFRPEALLSDVNVRFLESFEYWMRNVRGNMDTTISVKMRNLQRVINQAIEDKLFKQEDYPFGEKKYSINKRLDNRTKKIAISLDKIAKLKQLELETGSALHLAQQMFLFSYYSRVQTDKPSHK